LVYSKHMKLAVLLYGQPRFWESSWKSIMQETTFKDSTTDYYFHFWDKIAYNSDDPEYSLTDEDKEKIVSTYKPKKHSFTNYEPLTQACEEIYKIVEANKNKLKLYYDRTTKFSGPGNIHTYSEPQHISSIADIPLLAEDKYTKFFEKSIFEITRPENLRYYLGQFVSLQLGANLIEEDYDYIFRIRTDLLFITPDLYTENRLYEYDKKLFYSKLYEKRKGIFCKFGDLQIWEGAKDVAKEINLTNDMARTFSDGRTEKEQCNAEPDHQPIHVKNYQSWLCVENKIYAKKEGVFQYTGADENFNYENNLFKANDTHMYNPKTQYLHMKDWYMVGSGEDMLLSIDQYLETIKALIDKSRIFLKKDGIDINWAAGEIICGETLGLNRINAEELGCDSLETMVIPERLMKIANKFTKEFILNRPHIRVLTDTDKSLKKQYSNIIGSRAMEVAE